MPLEDFLELSAVTFVLTFTRVSGIFLFAPIVSSATFPARFRVMLGIVISILVVSVVQAPDVAVNNVVDLVLSMLGELLVGFILGSFLQMIFQSLQLAGQTAGQQLGLSLANVVNPQFDEQTSTISVVYATVASLSFFGIGAHREMFAALLETFEVLPLGSLYLSDSIRNFALEVFQESMIFAVRISSPAVVALLLAEIAMGFVGRTVPQLNILSVGFSLRILLGLFVIMASLTGSMDVFFEYMTSAFRISYEALAELVPNGMGPISP